MADVVVDDDCDTTSPIPLVVSVTYFSIFVILLCAAALRSILYLKRHNTTFNEASFLNIHCCNSQATENNESHSKLRMIWTSFSTKKDCYFELLPHLFDQASDIGVIIQFSIIKNNVDDHLCGNLNMNSIFIIIPCKYFFDLFDDDDDDDDDDE
eukprot:211268_1